MSASDWIGRAVMLVLAGLVTLSIMGAIAAIPNGIATHQLGLERMPQTPAQEPPLPVPKGAEPQPRPEPVESADPPAQPQGGIEEARSGSTQLAPVPAEANAPDVTRWLEAITYALLAIAGLLALGCLLLWRLLGEQRRIADALSAALPPSFAPSSAASRGG